MNKSKKDFYVEITELIKESQQEIDVGNYKGDYDIFRFMKKSKEYIEQLQAELKTAKKRCICGGEMVIFESNLGDHEREFCLVCKERFSNPGVHFESNNWYPDRQIPEQALTGDTK